jgi:hypothetical protein
MVVALECLLMQGLAEQGYIPHTPIVFPVTMGKRKPKTSPAPDPEPQTSFNPSKHGNLAQWFSAIVSAIAIILTLYFHYTANESKTGDEHVNALITANADPKFKEIERRLDELTAKVGDAEGQLKRLQGAVPDTRDKKLKLTAIKDSLDAAEQRKVVLPPAQLADYKNAIRGVPKSAGEYWTTVAAIINYQSFIQQMSGAAPDPAKVSALCLGLTNQGGMHSYGNVILGGAPISNCVVDLDTETFSNVTFKDSVIRYHGGPTILSNVRFVNCRFVLDIPVSTPTNPERNQFLMALLDAPDIKTVTVTSTRSPS